MKIGNLVLVLISLPLISAASDLVCAAKSRGFLPFNARTNTWIGEGYISEKGRCHEALDAQAQAFEQVYVCSWNGQGWNLYNSETGQPLNGGKSYWYSFSTCRFAAGHAYSGVICAPRSSGSGIFDIENDYFIGDGFYYDINVCTWGAFSANREKVCAPNQGYTSIFHRRYNRLVSDELFMTTEQCSKLIGD